MAGLAQLGGLSENLLGTLTGAMGGLGQRLNSPAIWRAMDALVALMMWGTALWLIAGLL